MQVTERTTCRLSKGPLIDVLSLGNLPFSCFPAKGDPAPELLPLTLAFNEESGLLQLRHTVSPDEMYSQYWYMSGVNQSMRDALKSIVDEALKRRGRALNPKDVVLDIASNDGTLLGAYPSHLFRVGIDPAKNIKPKNCDLHINTYFSADAYFQGVGERRADIVTSIAMFYDLEDPIQFSRDVHQVLKEDGLWIIELSYLPTMLRANSFDTICSEHLEYYSLYSMEYLLSRSGFAVEDVELNEVNGGSFRLYIRKESQKVSPSPAVLQMRESEKSLKLTDPQTYLDFARRIQTNKEEMLAFLHKQKELGKKVVGYGASTKGNTIMAYYGIGPELLSFVADRNPIKHGRHTVTEIPIISEEETRAMQPDYFLAFPYHFMKEFLSREEVFLQRGGKFVSPIPRLTIFSKQRTLSSIEVPVKGPIKTFVIGKNGLLGRAFYKELCAETFGTQHTSSEDPFYFNLETSHLDHLPIEKQGYTHAVIAASYGHVIESEQFPEKTHLCNVEKTLQLAAALAQRNITPILFSTSYVFDGKEGNYSEESPTCPVNRYGKQKAELEERLDAVCRGNYLIVRLDKVFTLELDDQTLFDEMATGLMADRPIRAAYDQILAPILVDDVVKIVQHLQQRSARGLFNLCNKDVASRLDLALRMAKLLSKSVDLVQKISLDDLQDHIPRPKNHSMCCDKIFATGAPFPTPLEMCMHQIAANWLARQSDPKKELIHTL